MDVTKEKIEQWLTNSHDGHKTIELSIDSGEQFHLVFRCKLGKKKPEKFLKTWLDKFSQFTLTNWIVHSTFPSLQRMVFRKKYICHRSNQNKATKDERIKANKRNKDCKATIDFRVKKSTKYTSRKDALLSEGFNCVFKVDFRHTHSIRSHESLSLLRCKTKTKNKIIGFYEAGMLPVVAKAYNEILIRAKYYDERERECQLSNAMINPSMRTIDRIYYTWRNENREFVFDSFKKICEDRTAIEATGAYIKIIENPKIIVVLTEFTKKVFLKYGQEIFIYSSGCEGKEVNYKTSIFVQTRVGALPIGYILHNGRTEEEYGQGFKVFASALKDYCGKELKPRVVMTGDGEQLEELGRIFPKSYVELCAYTNFTQFWESLWYPQNNVHQDDRKRLMTQYMDILTSPTRTECESLLREMKDDPKVKVNDELSEILTRLWSRREEWLSQIRETPFVRDTKKLTSTHMRIYQQVVSANFRKFNSYNLVKLFTGPIDDIYKMYLMQYALKGIATTPIFTIFYDTGDYNILPLSPNEYMVQSLKDLDHVHTVYTDIIYCTCKNGLYGYYCTHLCAVEKTVPFHPTPTIEESDRDFYNSPEMAPGIREAIEKIEESDDGIDQDDASKNLTGKSELDDRDMDFDETDINDYLEPEAEDDEVLDNAKTKVSIEILPSTSKQVHRKKSSLLKKEVGRISEMLENAKNKTRPLKRALEALKHAANIQSDDEAEPTSVAEVPSKAKIQRTEATSQDEESDIISRGWGLMYKRLKPKQKIYAKKAIDDILFEASLGTLGRNSVTINQSAMEVVEIDPFQVKDEVDQNDEDD